MLSVSSRGPDLFLYCSFSEDIVYQKDLQLLNSAHVFSHTRIRHFYGTHLFGWVRIPVSLLRGSILLSEYEIADTFLMIIES